jgi:hypothetical protein
MAEKLCALKKKGGGELKETTFWTNSSPTSSFTGGGITVPDITPYKLIKVTFRVSTSNSTTYYELYTPDQLLNAQYSGSVTGQLAILGFFAGSVLRYVRYFRAPSATSINFAGADNNNYIIPIKITGLK